MKYQADSNQPFTVVDVTRSGGELPEAMDAIAAHHSKSGKVILWYRDEGFSGDTEGLPKKQVEAKTISQALRVVEKGPAASYVIALDVAMESDDVLGTDDEMPVYLKRAATALESQSGRGKSLVLVVYNGDAKPWLGGIRHGEATLRAEVAEKERDVRELSGAVEKLETFDTPEWADAIDRLTPADLKRIVDKGEHRKSLERLRAAKALVCDHLKNREHAVEMMIACALAQVNMVFLGPPGTAKSLLVRIFSKTLGVESVSRPIAEEQAAMREARHRKEGKGRRMFEYLLTRYTTPEEIFGGVDINLLVSGGIHGRSTVGMLPQAETAFLDEIFKANSAILNTLLSITNERLFYNMGQAFKVKLAFVVGASNETPSEEELGALYDRFPIRVPCMPVSDADLGALMESAHKHACASGLKMEREHVPQVACLNDVRLLGKVVLGGMFGGTDAFEKESAFAEHFFALLKQLRKDYQVSDRTPVNILRVCRALAVLDGAATLQPEHLRAWGYVAPRRDQGLELQRQIAGRVLSFGGKPEGLFDGI